MSPIPQDSRSIAAASALTLGELGLPKLQRLVMACGQEELLAPATRLFELLARGWAQHPALSAPSWETDITDDGSPFEFSVAIDRGRAEVRLLAEPYQDRALGVMNGASLDAWRAGLEVNERLALHHAADLRRFELVRPVFAPRTAAPGKFLMWHAATLHEDGTPAFKLYLNPRTATDPHGLHTAASALRALEMPDAAHFLERHTPLGTIAPYFSLDLSSSDTARAKVYVADVSPSLRALDASLASAGLLEPGQAEAWLETLTAGRKPFGARPILLCHSFVQGAPKPTVTLHVPIREYVDDDEQALARALRLLDEQEGELLRRAVLAVAERPLDVGRSLITYVSLRVSSDKPRVTTYLSPELFGIAAPRRTRRSEPPRYSMVRELAPEPPRAEQRPVNTPRTFDDVRELVESKRKRLAQHPLMARLERSPTLEELRVVGKSVAFFILCFRDALRIVATRVRDPELAALAKVYDLGDRGHEFWYLADLERLGSELEVAWLFGEAHRCTRDVAHEIVALALRTREDAALLSLLVALEGTGQEFFPRMVRALARFEREEPFEFFGETHVEAEAGHDPFEPDSPVYPGRLLVSPEAAAEILELVERTFAAVEQMADGIEHALMGESARSAAE